MLLRTTDIARLPEHTGSKLPSTTFQTPKIVAQKPNSPNTPSQIQKLIPMFQFVDFAFMTAALYSYAIHIEREIFFRPQCVDILAI